MDLESIDFKKLRRVDIKTNWGVNDVKLERFFYSDESLFYKLWSRVYSPRNLIADRGEYVLYDWNDTAAGLVGFDIGFYDNDICPGFVDLVNDSDGVCRGYVSEIGKPLKDVPLDYQEKVWERTVETGYCHMDFCAKNIVAIGDKCSLIDLDTTFTKMATIDLEFEKAKGCLRGQATSFYRNNIIEQIDGR